MCMWLCVCLAMCVCVAVHVCVAVYMFGCVCLCGCVLISISMFTEEGVAVWLCACVCGCVHVYVAVCVFGCVCLCGYVCLCGCACLCGCEHVYVAVCVFRYVCLCRCACLCGCVHTCFNLAFSLCLQKREQRVWLALMQLTLMYMWRWAPVFCSIAMSFPAQSFISTKIVNIINQFVVDIERNSYSFALNYYSQKYKIYIVLSQLQMVREG